MQFSPGDYRPDAVLPLIKITYVKKQNRSIDLSGRKKNCGESCLEEALEIHIPATASVDLSISTDARGHQRRWLQQAPRSTATIDTPNQRSTDSVSIDQYDYCKPGPRVPLDNGLTFQVALSPNDTIVHLRMTHADPAEVSDVFVQLADCRA